MPSHRICILLTILNLFLRVMSSNNDYCTTGTCVCVDDSVSCSNKGFTEMPTYIHNKTRRFTLKGQHFSNKFLSRNNFTFISPPYAYLEDLFIRSSNINRLKSEALSDLTSLKNFDFTYNADLYIESRSFSGLNLKLLKLDHNVKLKFSIDAFVGLKVEALHMSSSSIEDVPYDLLKPILPYLKKLFLGNNKMIVLDQRFQDSFKYLEYMDLQGNSFSCTCSMKWLTDVYNYRFTNGKSSKEVFTQNAPISPICKEPKYIEGKYMHDVPLAMFNCDPPNLTQLKIDFQSQIETELSCSAVQTVDQAEMTVNWFTDFLNVFGKRFINSDIHNKKVHMDTILIQRNNSIDSFQCIAKNQNGNATAIVRISWPPTEVSLKKDRNFYQSTIDSWQKSDEDNYLFQKRFTLLEIFGAVFGTFAITLIVFFVIYRLAFINRNIDRKTMLPPNGYTTYEAAVYSDSQTYDIPGNSYPQSVLLPMPHLSTTPDHFIDFKTQKKFYQTT